jgi:hypothetical protein
MIQAQEHNRTFIFKTSIDDSRTAGASFVFAFIDSLFRLTNAVLRLRVDPTFVDMIAKFFTTSLLSALLFGGGMFDSFVELMTSIN